MTRCAFALAAMVGICRAAQVQSQGPLFADVRQVLVGAGSGQVELVDVDQDRHLDIVTRHLLQRSVGVLLGDGKGGFTHAAASPIALGYQPGSIAVADLSGDTIPDLAVANSERDNVDVFLGNRKGGFNRAAGAPFAASASVEFYTRVLRLADINDDRRLDILTANGRDNTIGILFGDGRGRFAAGPTVRRESMGGRHAFAFGDVDGDGRVDVVVAGRAGETPEPGRVVILRSDGTGAFQEMGPPFAVSPGPHFLTLADVTGDRRLDLVITHSGVSLLSVLVNDGRGTFTRSPGSPFDIRTEAFAVVVADVDGDRRADLLAATANSATVLLGDGRGGFVPGPGSPFQAGPGAYNIAAGDINEDGKVDVATSSFEGNTLTVLLGR